LSSSIRGTKDQARLLLRHDASQGGQVLHIAHQAGQGQVREALAEVLLDLVQRKLAQLEQHQPRRTEASDLATQLGTDGAPRACDQHHLATDQAGQRRLIELHLLAAQQVLGLDVADAVDA
jgi:hypothetical protein